jgi:hypothetical protein
MRIKITVTVNMCTQIRNTVTLQHKNISHNIFIMKHVHFPGKTSNRNLSSIKFSERQSHTQSTSDCKMKLSVEDLIAR